MIPYGYTIVTLRKILRRLQVWGPGWELQGLGVQAVAGLRLWVLVTAIPAARGSFVKTGGGGDHTIDPKNSLIPLIGMPKKLPLIWGILKPNVPNVNITFTNPKIPLYNAL